MKTTGLEGETVAMGLSATVGEPGSLVPAEPTDPP
jgi:hypothetical protein